MVFSSLIFIFRFLPVFFLIYLCAPAKFRNFVLLVGSMYFYSWGEPKYAILIILSILVNFFIAMGIGHCRKKADLQISKGTKAVMRLLMSVAVVYNVGLLMFFKYSTFFEENIEGIFGYQLSLPKVALPLGISFYTFQILSYVIDVYRGTVEYETSIVNLGAYLCMFPQLIAGPIVVYSKVAEQMNKPDTRIECKDFEEGLRTFTLGLGSKVLLANRFGQIWNSAAEAGYDSVSTPMAWICIAAYTLQIYFDFNGYSMMAVGLGKMLGFRFPKNFNHPYIARSVTDFWKRWHITLTDWFRNYIYIPLGGNREGKFKMYRNMLIVWLITGFWHGAGWNFVIWGLYYFVLLLNERLWLKKVLDKSVILSHIYTMAAVMCGWVIFAITKMDQIGIYFTRMFTWHWNIDFIPVLKTYGILFIPGILLSTPFFAEWYRRARRRLPGTVVLLVIFWASVVALVDAVYNPFLYFRF